MWSKFIQKYGIVLGTCFIPLPDVTDKSEFSSDYTSKLAIDICLYSSMENMFMPHMNCPCYCTIYSCDSSYS